MLTRARMVLKSDHGQGGPGWSDAAIVGALDVNASTVLRVRRQFVKNGLTVTLERKCPDRVYDRPHSPASLDTAFPPAKATRLADKWEIHYTPKHGSWLNLAELDVRVRQRQCLKQRLADRAAMEREVAA